MHSKIGQRTRKSLYWSLGLRIPNELLRLVMLLRVPGDDVRPQRIAAVVRAVDIMPTPTPEMIVVAGPVTDWRTIDLTGRVPVPV